MNSKLAELNNPDTLTEPVRKGFLHSLVCNHNWVKRERFHQPSRDSGKVAWVCTTCARTTKLSRHRSP